MAFQLSPGVLVSEVDTTTVVPSVSTTIGGLAGASVWGPANNVVLVSSESQFADTFGKPDANTYGTFFTAANFLAYGANFKFARSVGTAAKNAAGGGVSTPHLILNKDDYEANYSSNTTTFFHAKYAGALGNSLKVSMCDSNGFSTWAYSGYFDSAPGTSVAATNKNSANDELHIVVVDEDGAFSSTANTVLERFAYATKASDIKNPDGTSNYYKDVINTKSRYIWWTGHPNASNLVAAADNNWGTSIAGAVTFKNLAGNLTSSLAGGVDDTPTAANISATYDLFSNADAEEVSFLMAGVTTGTTIPNKLISLAETRKDCIVFASYSYTNATYSANHADANTKGKKVENAPANILRAGITFSIKSLQVTAQISKVDETFSDANNTRVASTNGNTGLIPAYNVTDLSATYKISKHWNIKSGINNLMNTIYFTRRAGGFPGPGALPADGRNFFITVAAKL